MATQIAPYAIQYGYYPPKEEGPRAFRLQVDLTGVEQQVFIEVERAKVELSNIQTVKIDNSAGTGTITVRTSLTRDIVKVPAGKTKTVPLNIGDDNLIFVSGTNGDTFIAYMFNVPMPSLDETVVAAATTITIPSVARVPALVRTSGAGNIAAGTQKASFANIGGAAGTVLGVSIDPGTVVPFEANLKDTLGVIAYDATGTTFLINTLT